MQGFLITDDHVKVVKAGEEVLLHCSTSLEYPINFDFVPTGSDQIQHIFFAGFESDSHVDRISMKRERNGTHNLRIFSVKLSDAGRYTCIEDSGSGSEREFYEVVVIGKSIILGIALQGRMQHFSLERGRIRGAEGAEKRGVQGADGVGSGRGYLPSQKFL